MTWNGMPEDLAILLQYKAIEDRRKLRMTNQAKSDISHCLFQSNGYTMFNTLSLYHTYSLV